MTSVWHSAEEQNIGTASGDGAQTEVLGPAGVLTGTFWGKNRNGCLNLRLNPLEKCHFFKLSFTLLTTRSSYSLIRTVMYFSTKQFLKTRQNLIKWESVVHCVLIWDSWAWKYLEQGWRTGLPLGEMNQQQQQQQGQQVTRTKVYFLEQSDHQQACFWSFQSLRLK